MTGLLYAVEVLGQGTVGTGGCVLRHARFMGISFLVEEAKKDDSDVMIDVLRQARYIRFICSIP